MNKYEKKSKGRLIEILKLRSQPQWGTKAELVARLLEHDKTRESLKSSFPEHYPDVTLMTGRYLLYDGSVPQSRSTVLRVADALRNNNSPYRLIDINNEAYFQLYWEQESKGRSLPALVKQGCIVGVSCEILVFVIHREQISLNNQLLI